MNERDTEIASVVYGSQWTMQDMEFAALIRADERRALIHYFADHWRSDWSDGQIIEALEARGNI